MDEYEKAMRWKRVESAIVAILFPVICFLIFVVNSDMSKWLPRDIEFMIAFEFFVVMLGATLYVSRQREWTAHFRERYHRCPKCGYDLRHDPDTCPECGHHNKKGE